MISYLVKRLSFGFFVIFGVATVVFLIFHALPADPVSMLAGQRSDLKTQNAIRADLGLDKPLIVQYSRFLNDLSPFSIHRNEELKRYKYYILFDSDESSFVFKEPYLGQSFQFGSSVNEIIKEHAIGTAVLAFSSLFFATIIGILLGVFSAVNVDSIADRSTVFFSVLGISFPSFISGLFIALIFGYWLSDYTGLNMSGYMFEYDAFEGRYLSLKNLILPMITLGIRPVAIITQLTRSSMLEVLSQDFIRTARAKGLSERNVIFRHGLRNALNPIVTAVSGWLASLFAGTFFVERIFNWKGLGLMTVNAIEALDFPLLIGASLFVAVVFVFINLLVDIIYLIIDPKVKLA